MCQDRYSLYAPCAHTGYQGSTKCKRAESLGGALKYKLLHKKCKPANVIVLIIDWCPLCKVVFDKVIHTIGVHPAAYNNFWEPTLMERYWAIKSQRCHGSAASPEWIGPLAFKSSDPIDYREASPGSQRGEKWELRALMAEVHRLKPVCMWIQDRYYAPAIDQNEQLHLCKVSLVETQRRAKGDIVFYHFVCLVLLILTLRELDATVEKKAKEFLEKTWAPPDAGDCKKRELIEIQDEYELLLKNYKGAEPLPYSMWPWILYQRCIATTH
ncbi:hypothetical protein IL306_014318 [Fusarium sp. DS 682]|nr:hypothetical protein IL306_014318 [Fusarium sp. DS 682]